MRKKGLINMNALTLLCLLGFSTAGCDNSFKITKMAGIQKMDNVVEITMWDCRGRPIDANGCEGMTESDNITISDKQRISEIMSAIKELEIIPDRGSMKDDLICFKNKNNEVLCTNIHFGSDDIYGSDYEDRTGRLSESLLIALSGYKSNVNFRETTMAEIQKMKDVVEISLWECNGRNANNWCTDKTYQDSSTDKKKIAAVMSVIRKIKIEPEKDFWEGDLICFKDKTGKMLCTNMEIDNKTVSGSDYKDETGNVYFALRNAFIGCEDGISPCPTPMSEIQKMNDVIKISMRNCTGMKNANEFIGLEEWAGTSDRQKIKEIMSVVREINEITPSIWAAGEQWICFENSDGKVLCTCIYHGDDKQLYGSAYDDNTGKLYDALQNAGLLPKRAENEPNNANSPAKEP